MSEGRFPFKILAKYPHMKPEDVAVWQRLIENNPGFFDSVDYDVPVGEGAPQNPEHPANISYDGKILTQKKIDAVCYTSGATFIVEIGPIADMRKLGQILTYLKLYGQTYPGASNVIGMVVCGAVERELEPMFAEHNIMLKLA